MIYSDSSPISFQDPLPASVDVVIVGGGVIGTATAWYLSQRGVSVLLCDKGRVAGEQSSRNWGWIRQQGRDPAELPIVIDSINQWQAVAPQLDEDIGFTRQGVVYTAETDAQMAEYERWMEHARQYQLDTRLLSSSEVDDLTGSQAKHWRGAMFTPSDGRAEPFKTVPALARSVRKQGGAIREACAVRSVDVQAGRVAGVITEHGRVATQAVVCAGGAWSSLFLANLGITLPQLTVRATVARTEPVADFFTGNVALSEIAIRRRQDGGYTVAASASNEHFIGADSFRYFFKYLPALAASVRYLRLRLGNPAGVSVMQQMLPQRSWQADAQSPFEQHRVLNPKPSPGALAAMRKGLQKRVPQLADVPFAEAWAGMIDVTPDVVPVMDQVPDYPGLFVATGFSGHGFGIGLGAGRVMADLVQGRPAAHDLTRFRFSRFSDGSAMQPGPGL
ncbi:MAG: FAD-binding oxidoreductase [Pseudomonadota bacterium]